MANPLQSLLSDIALKVGGNDMSVVSGLLNSFGIDPADDEATFSKEQATQLLDYLTGKLTEDEISDFTNKLSDLVVVPTSTASLADAPSDQTSAQDAARHKFREMALDRALGKGSFLRRYPGAAQIGTAVSTQSGTSVRSGHNTAGFFGRFPEAARIKVGGQ